jgi:hypothetical protein
MVLNLNKMEERVKVNKIKTSKKDSQNNAIMNFLELKRQRIQKKFLKVIRKQV